MRGLRTLTAQSPAIVISIIALVFPLGGGAGYAAAGSRIGQHRARRPSCGATTFSWHDLHLINGWKPAPGILDSGRPAYALRGGIVYLRGAIYQPVPGSGKFAFLPPGNRPAHNLLTIIYTSAGAAGTLVIATTGVMLAVGGNAAVFSSLAPVSFPRTS